MMDRVCDCSPTEGHGLLTGGVAASDPASRGSAVLCANVGFLSFALSALECSCWVM